MSCYCTRVCTLADFEEVICSETLWIHMYASATKMHRHMCTMHEYMRKQVDTYIHAYIRKLYAGMY